MSLWPAVVLCAHAPPNLTYHKGQVRWCMLAHPSLDAGGVWQVYQCGKADHICHTPFPHREVNGTLTIHIAHRIVLYTSLCHQHTSVTLHVAWFSNCILVSLTSWSHLDLMTQPTGTIMAPVSQISVTCHVLIRLGYFSSSTMNGLSETVNSLKCLGFFIFTIKIALILPQEGNAEVQTICTFYIRKKYGTLAYSCSFIDAVSLA